MQIYASSHAIEQACETLPDLNLRKLFQERYQQLKSDDYEIHELVHFWVVESAEDLKALTQTPECKEEHPGCTTTLINFQSMCGKIAVAEIRRFYSRPMAAPQTSN